MIDVATLGLAVDSGPVRQGTDALSRFKREAGDTERATSRASKLISGGLGGIAKAAVALGATVGAAFSFSAVISEAEKFETAMFRINAIIRATGGAAGKSADQLREQARQIALSTLESTEGVLAAQQTLLTFRKVQGEVFDRALMAAVDLSAAMGTDLRSSVLQIAKALENPTEGLSALSRSGTVFTKQQKEMVKEMIAAGRTAEAQALILAELEAQYKGTAEAAAAGIAGAKDTFGQAFQELLLAIDRSIGLSSTAAEAYRSAADGLNFLGQNMDRIAAYVKAGAVALTAYFTPAIVAAVAALGRMAVAILFTRTALIRAGWGALVVALGEIVYRLDKAAEAAGGWGELIVLAGRAADQALDITIMKLAEWGSEARAAAMEFAALMARRFGDDASAKWAEEQAAIARGYAKAWREAATDAGDAIDKFLDKLSGRRQGTTFEVRGEPKPDFFGPNGGKGGPSLPGAGGGAGRGNAADEPDEMLGKYVKVQYAYGDELEKYWGRYEGVAVESMQRVLTKQGEINRMMATNTSDIFGSMAESVGQFAGEASNAYRALFAISKAFAIAESTIKISQAMAYALATPFPANLGAIAIVAAEGAAILAAISSVSQSGFKAGGYTGNMGVDQVAGVVHGREFVFDAGATSRIGVDNLERMRRGSFGAMPGRGLDQVKILVIVQESPIFASRVQAEAENVAIEVSRESLRQYSRQAAPRVVRAVNRDPRRIG